MNFGRGRPVGRMDFGNVPYNYDNEPGGHIDFYQTSGGAFDDDPVPFRGGMRGSGMRGGGMRGGGMRRDGVRGGGADYGYDFGHDGFEVEDDLSHAGYDFGHDGFEFEDDLGHAGYDFGHEFEDDLGHAGSGFEYGVIGEHDGYEDNDDMPHAGHVRPGPSGVPRPLIMGGTGVTGMGGMARLDQPIQYGQPYDGRSGNGEVNQPLNRRRPYDHYAEDLDKPAPQKKKKKKKPRYEEVVADDGEDGEVKCEVCSLTLESRKAYKVHALSEEHIKILEKQLIIQYYKDKAEKAGEKFKVEEANTNTGTWSADDAKCVVCEIDFEIYKDYAVHAEGTYHKLKVRQASGEELSAMCLVDESRKPWGRSEEIQNDTGEEQGKFFCKICSVDCGCMQNFDAHIKGARHRKKLQKLSMTNEEYQKATANLTGVKIGYRTLLEETTEPLIGVEYIYHYKNHADDDHNFAFSCLICDSPLSFVNLLSHLTGWKHRRKYIKYHRPEQYQEVLLETNVSKKAATEAAREIATEIEAETGRQRPRLRTFIPAKEAQLIMEYEPDRTIVQYRNCFWEEVYDGRPPPRTREELDADFEHWKKVTGVQLPYETAESLEPDELIYLREMQRRKRFVPQSFKGQPSGRFHAGPSHMGGGRPFDDERMGGVRPLIPERTGDVLPPMQEQMGPVRPFMDERFRGPRSLMHDDGDSVRPLMNLRMGGVQPLIREGTKLFKDLFFRPDPSYYEEERMSQPRGRYPNPAMRLLR